MQIHTKYKRPTTRLWTSNQPSKTVPDQTISLKTMVTKYVKGLPISAPNYNGIYTDDDVATDFQKLDLAEQEEAIFRASNELSQKKATINQEKQKLSAEAKEKAEKAEQKIKDLENQLQQKLASTT